MSHYQIEQAAFLDAEMVRSLSGQRTRTRVPIDLVSTTFSDKLQKQPFLKLHLVLQNAAFGLLSCQNLGSKAPEDFLCSIDVRSILT